MTQGNTIQQDAMIQEEKLINEEYKIWKKNSPFLYEYVIVCPYRLLPLLSDLSLLLSAISSLLFTGAFLREILARCVWLELCFIALSYHNS